MILMTEKFEKENAGYLEQYLYSLDKNESGNYKSNDTQILYYGWRQSQSKIQTLQEQNKAQAEEIEKLKADREKLINVLKDLNSVVCYSCGSGDVAEETLKSIGEIG